MVLYLALLSNHRLILRYNINEGNNELVSVQYIYKKLG